MGMKIGAGHMNVARRIDTQSQSTDVKDGHASIKIRQTETPLSADDLFIPSTSAEANATNQLLAERLGPAYQAATTDSHSLAKEIAKYTQNNTQMGYDISPDYEPIPFEKKHRDLRNKPKVSLIQTTRQALLKTGLATDLIAPNGESDQRLHIATAWTNLLMGREAKPIVDPTFFRELKCGLASCIPDFGSGTTNDELTEIQFHSRVMLDRLLDALGYGVKNAMTEKHAWRAANLVDFAEENGLPYNEPIFSSESFWKSFAKYISTYPEIGHVILDKFEVSAPTKMRPPQTIAANTEPSQPIQSSSIKSNNSEIPQKTTAAVHVHRIKREPGTFEHFLEMIGLGQKNRARYPRAEQVYQKYKKQLPDWFRATHTACQKEGIDMSHLVAMGIHESGNAFWDPDQVSSTGCAGVFQFESGTGRLFGLKCGSTKTRNACKQLKNGDWTLGDGTIKDERMNVTKAVYAAAQLIAEHDGRFSKERYPDGHLRFRLMTASYNIGPGTVALGLHLYKDTHKHDAQYLGRIEPYLQRAWATYLAKKEFKVKKPTTEQIDKMFDSAAKKMTEVYAHNDSVFKVFKELKNYLD